MPKRHLHQLVILRGSKDVLCFDSKFLEYPGNNFPSLYLAIMYHPIRRYLQEIGYTDTIIDVRSNKVKTLLGLNNINNNNTNNNNNPNLQEECIPSAGSQTVNGNVDVSKNKRLSATQGRKNTKKVSPEYPSLSQLCHR